MINAPNTSSGSSGAGCKDVGVNKGRLDVVVEGVALCGVLPASRALHPGDAAGAAGRHRELCDSQQRHTEGRRGSRALSRWAGVCAAEGRSLTCRLITINAMMCLVATFYLGWCERRVWTFVCYNISSVLCFAAFGR